MVSLWTPHIFYKLWRCSCLTLVFSRTNSGTVHRHNFWDRTEFNKIVSVMMKPKKFRQLSVNILCRFQCFFAGLQYICTYKIIRQFAAFKVKVQQRFMKCLDRQVYDGTLIKTLIKTPKQFSCTLTI